MIFSQAPSTCLQCRQVRCEHTTHAKQTQISEVTQITTSCHTVYSLTRNFLQRYRGHVEPTHTQKYITYNEMHEPYHPTQRKNTNGTYKVILSIQSSPYDTNCRRKSTKNKSSHVIGISTQRQKFQAEGRMRGGARKAEGGELSREGWQAWRAPGGTTSPVPAAGVGDRSLAHALSLSASHSCCRALQRPPVRVALSLRRHEGSNVFVEAQGISGVTGKVT